MVKISFFQKKILYLNIINNLKLKDMGYSHQNSKGKTYFLHSKDVVLKGGRNQTIYYFAKEAKAGACDLPAGKTVVENTKTGLPFLKGK